MLSLPSPSPSLAAMQSPRASVVFHRAHSTLAAVIKAERCADMCCVAAETQCLGL